ncbi:MAG: hypothetical protein QCI38_06075 [Candidatus Thermoplasmatota archaeon]|nr:hypothetical protein [Candidatus Thermoplasmatota archaeon]
MTSGKNIEIQVERELDNIFDGLAQTIISLEKKKLGITGDIPTELTKDFIEGVIILCRNMVGAGMVQEIEERLRKLEEIP